MPVILDPLAPSVAQPSPATAGALVFELAQRVGDFAAGVVTNTSSDTTYLDDNQRPEPDNSYAQGWLSYTPTAGSLAQANASNEVRITSYDGTINVGRFGLTNVNGAMGLSYPAQAGDSYYVHMRWSKRRKIAALNRAIHRLPQGFWRRIEDTSIVTQDRTWTYPLPAGLINLFEVWVQTSTNLSGPGALAVGQDGRGFPFARLTGWFVRTDVATNGAVTRTLQLNDLPAWPRTLRLVGTGVLTSIASDLDTISCGQDDYDQRLQEYLLSYAEGYLWKESANGVTVDQSTRALEMMKTAFQLAAELRNDLVMPPPPLESDTPATVERHGWGDNPFYFAALHTPGPVR